ncbi:uncharacterized protein LOC124302810 [Neodiprion virginianus]|uniref:uncharacterized protein LOC124302810 n=1 Tax=Neodiprion virginianus TaxID=2961670 RepID=UPI001EE6F7CA|nr:uncharacterized protein LOC124302810 [Neodiprion virginianus]
MDNEVPSLSNILTDSNSDVSIQDKADQKFTQEIDKDDYSEESLSRDESSDSAACSSAYDRQNFSQVNDLTNDGEDLKKLTEVIENPEKTPSKDTIVNETAIGDETFSPRSDEIFERNNILQERISELNKVVQSLRGELQREISLWRKERDEFQILEEKSDLLALEEATAAARAAAEAYAAESPLSNDLDNIQFNYYNHTTNYGNILDINPEQTLSELTILEYEKKLAKYQDALALAQAEKRYNMRRQLAANTYRHKLMEVERLCDEELEKIRQNANSLQPLKQMVSQWYSDDRCGGDVDKSGNPSDQLQKSFSFSSQNGYTRTTYCDIPRVAKVDAEVNMAPEIFVAKFNLCQSDYPSTSIESGSSWITESDYNLKSVNGAAANPPHWKTSHYNLSTSIMNGNP